MTVRYVSGIRVGGLTFDPVERVDTAVWTHRPARRPPAGRVLTSAELARVWGPALGLPVQTGAIAMGARIELLPSGYGPGGVAALLTRAGRRTLVVGPTSTRLEPRRAERLVMLAPPRVDEAWRDALPAPGTSARLFAPDGAALVEVCRALAERGVAHRRPAWSGLGRGPREASVDVRLGGGPDVVDARPQADEAWLVSYADRVAPRMIFLHGHRAEALASALAARGHAVRVLHAPKQLSFLDDGLDAPQPAGEASTEEVDRR